MGDLSRKMSIVAQRRTRKEVGLGNALPEKWGCNTTDLSMMKTMHLWFICTYTYLRNIGPISSWCLSFLKSWSVGSKLRWLFLSCLLESSLVILTSGKGFISSYFFVFHLLSQGLPILPGIFLIKGIMKPTLPGVFDCPPAWSCPQVFNSGLGMRLCEGRFDKELFSCRNFGISKLFQTQKSFWHRFKANLFWRNSSDSYREVFRSDENFLFWFWWKIWSDSWLVKKV